MDVSRETRARLERVTRMVLEENSVQNLVGASTVPDFWTRHIDDSLQLLDHAPAGLWLDIGTGGGFPGLVVAAARTEPVFLVEPRTRRAAFLQQVIDALDLAHARVFQYRIEQLPPCQAAAISARAVAPLDRLLDMSVSHAANGCVWLLSKGRRAADELAVARERWHGDFTLLPSRTDPEASIIMVRNPILRVGSVVPR